MWLRTAQTERSKLKVRLINTQLIAHQKLNMAWQFLSRFDLWYQISANNNQLKEKQTFMWLGIGQVFYLRFGLGKSLWTLCLNSRFCFIIFEIKLLISDLNKELEYAVDGAPSQIPMLLANVANSMMASLGGSVGCAIRLETWRSRVQPPSEVGNIHSWRLIMKYFLWSFSPFRWFKKGSCQFLAKECAQYWLTA